MPSITVMTLPAHKVYEALAILNEGLSTHYRCPVAVALGENQIVIAEEYTTTCDFVVEQEAFLHMDYQLKDIQL